LAPVRGPTLRGQVGAEKRPPSRRRRPWKYRTTWRPVDSVDRDLGLGTPPSAAAVTVTSRAAAAPTDNARSCRPLLVAPLSAGKGRLPAGWHRGSSLFRRSREDVPSVGMFARRHPGRGAVADELASGGMRTGSPDQGDSPAVLIVRPRTADAKSALCPSIRNMCWSHVAVELPGSCRRARTRSRRSGCRAWPPFGWITPAGVSNGRGRCPGSTARWPTTSPST